MVLNKSTNALPDWCNFIDKLRITKVVILKLLHWHYRCKQVINSSFMNKENQNKTSLQSSREGSGSAENKGQDRSQQQAKNTRIDQKEKQDIANLSGVNKSKIADQQDLGMLSGRDDASGGSGDRMEDQNTGQATDR
jgi:hypothetical protein